MKKGFKRITGVMLSIILVLSMSVVPAFAAEGDPTPIPNQVTTAEGLNDILGKQVSGDADMFSKINDVVSDAGASLKKVIVSFAIIFIFCALILAGLMISSGNTATKNQGKLKIAGVLLSALIIFGAGYIIRAMLNFSNIIGTGLASGI